MALPSLLSFCPGFESGIPHLSPQGYSSSWIALHSSNEVLHYTVFVFFLKHQSDIIPGFGNKLKTASKKKKQNKTGKGHEKAKSQEKNTHIHMWKVVHLHYELNVTMTFSHLFNGHFVRTYNKECKSVEKCPYISLVVENILDDILAMFWIGLGKQTTNYLWASITAFGQIGLIPTLMILRKWDNSGERDL